MNSSKVKTQNSVSSKSPRLLSGQKTLSAIIAMALAMVTLFQAAAANSNEARYVSAEEEALIAEAEAFFAEDIDMEIEELILLEELDNTTESVKVYNQHNELIGEGNPDTNPLLGQLVNMADYLSEMAGEKYYRITE